MQSLIRSKSAGVTGGRGTAGAGPGRDLLYAVMRAVASLWAAPSAAATAARMEGMSSGCSLGVGGWGRPAVTWRPGGPIWSAAVGEAGAGLRSSPSRRGWAGVLQCWTLSGLAPAGGNSLRRLHSGARGAGPGFPGVCAGGMCGPLGRVGVLWGVGLHAVGVCGSSGVGGAEGCSAGGFVAGVCVCLCGFAETRVVGPRGAHDGGRVWAAGRVAGREGQGRGLRRGGVLYRCMCPLAALRLCGQL